MKYKMLMLSFVLLLSSASGVLAQAPQVTLTEALTLSGFGGSAIDVAWSPDGAKLAVASGDMLVKIFDAHTGELLHTLTGHQREAVSVMFSHDGTKLSSTDLAGGVIIWDAETGDTVQTLATGSDFIETAAWSPDDHWLAVATSLMAATPGDPTGYAIQIWDTTTWEINQTLLGHTLSVADVAWSPDGTQLASAGTDGIILLWDASTWDIPSTLTYEALINGYTSVVWSPDGASLVAAHFNNTLQIWDAKNTTLVSELKGHTDFIGGVDWSGNLIASGSGSPVSPENDHESIRIWDATTGAALATVEQAHEQGIRTVVWSPDGTQLATAGDDNLVKIWNISVQ